LSASKTSFPFREEAIPTTHLLIFNLDEQRYGLRLSAVERVVRAAAITPLPQAPDLVLGILDLQGEVIPVINLRKRFRLPERETRSDDQFIVARTGTIRLALLVDSTEGVLELSDLTLTAPDRIVTGLNYLEAVTRTAEGLILIHDLETLLFPAERELIIAALEQIG
jgi:purine-binding chemotaxis protein CheW